MEKFRNILKQNFASFQTVFFFYSKTLFRFVSFQTVFSIVNFVSFRTAFHTVKFRFDCFVSPSQIRF